MDFKFSKDSNESQKREETNEKKSQGALLLLLLALVGGFIYVYFFTNLIKPDNATQTAAITPQADQPQIVKMPLPAREAGSVKPIAKPAEKVEIPKTATVPSPKPTIAKSLPAAAPKPLPIAAPKTVQPTPNVVAGKAAKPAQPVVVTKKNQPKAQAIAKADAKKTDSTVEKLDTNSKKKPAVKEAHKKSQPAVKSKETESWSLNVGNYVLEEKLSTAMAHIRKAGFQPVVKTAARRKTAMNRLLVSESDNRLSAQKTLVTLKQHTSDAFIMEQGGKFAVYAGSYMQSDSANTQKERLKASGFTVTIKRADIEIPSRTLSVGPFKSKKAALSAIERLKKTGIKATLSEK